MPDRQRKHISTEKPKKNLYKTNVAIWYKNILRKTDYTQLQKTSSILVLLGNCLQTCMTYLYTIAECTVNNS